MFNTKIAVQLKIKNYANKSVPILDMKANLDPKSNFIMNYEFYEKPSKNQHVILASSSLSWPKKRTILTQEALRRMRNTKNASTMRMKAGPCISVFWIPAYIALIILHH
mgnify:CR=1 FL=1